MIKVKSASRLIPLLSNEREYKKQKSENKTCRFIKEQV